MSKVYDALKRVGEERTRGVGEVLSSAPVPVSHVHDAAGEVMHRWWSPRVLRRQEQRLDTERWLLLSGELRVMRSRLERLEVALTTVWQEREHHAQLMEARIGGLDRELTERIDVCDAALRRRLARAEAGLSILASLLAGALIVVLLS